MPPLLIQAVFLPIILSPLAYLLGKRVGGKAGWFAFAVLLYSTLLLLLSAFYGADYLEEYPWQPIGTFGLRLDGLSLPFAATIYILSTVLAVYSIPYMTHRIEEEVEGFRPLSILTLMVYASPTFFIDIQRQLRRVVILSAYENIRYQDIILIIGAPKEGLS